ncbi:MAG: hypothetical protein C4331_16295 [Meiothermus sp.]
MYLGIWQPLSEHILDTVQAVSLGTSPGIKSGKVCQGPKSSLSASSRATEIGIQRFPVRLWHRPFLVRKISWVAAFFGRAFRQSLTSGLTVIPHEATTESTTGGQPAIGDVAALLCPCAELSAAGGKAAPTKEVQAQRGA